MEELFDVIFSNDGFYLSLNSESVLPVNHPNYYDGRLNIVITDDDTLKKFGVENEKLS